jgi:DNA-binding response OmpR family regulator
MDGKELLCRLRAGPHGNVPVLMLTARDELPDKIAGFRAGADDYMTKPFALPELEVRLEAVLARAGAQSQPRAASGRSETGSGDTGGHARGPAAASVPGVPALLEVLMQASPAAVGRERLEQALWGDEPPDGDMLRSHIYELRRSVDGPFEVKLIQTLPRVGYRLAVPGEDIARAP